MLLSQFDKIFSKYIEQKKGITRYGKQGNEKRTNIFAECAKP